MRFMLVGPVGSHRLHKQVLKAMHLKINVKTVIIRYLLNVAKGTNVIFTAIDCVITAHLFVQR